MNAHTKCLSIALGLLLSTGCALNRQPHPNQTGAGGETGLGAQPGNPGTSDPGPVVQPTGSPNPGTQPASGGDMGRVFPSGGAEITHAAMPSPGGTTGGTRTDVDSMAGNQAGGTPIGGQPAGGDLAGGMRSAGTPAAGASAAGAPAAGAPAGGEPVGSVGGQPAGGGQALCQECFAHEMELTSDGGNVAWRSSVLFSPCREVTYRIDERIDGDPLSCVQDWNRCSPEESVTIAQILAAESHPAVQDALAGDGQGQPKLYGFDDRPVDGVLTKVRVAEKSVLVGRPCAGRDNFDGGPCVDPPAELRTFIDLLRRVSDVVEGHPECQAILP